MDLVCNLCLSLPYGRVCFAQSCGHLLGKGWPLGSPVCDVFVCFCHFLIRCPESGGTLIVSIPNLCLLPYYEHNLFDERSVV